MFDWLFGSRKPEDLEERSARVYHDRMLRVRAQVNQNSDVQNRLQLAFEYVYLKSPLRSDVLFLGQGDDHVVLNVGVVRDYVNSRDVHLAIRLKHAEEGDSQPYSLGLREGPIASEIIAFEEAFINRKNPPYFACAVSWKDKSRKFKDKLLGVLVEDVTEAGKHKLCPVESTLGQIFRRKDGNGNQSDFFLDPSFIYSVPFNCRYLSADSRIDI